VEGAKLVNSLGNYIRDTVDHRAEAHAISEEEGLRLEALRQERKDEKNEAVERELRRGFDDAGEISREEAADFIRMQRGGGSGAGGGGEGPSSGAPPFGPSGTIVLDPLHRGTPSVHIQEVPEDETDRYGT
jgi:hypothetical protein